MQNTPDALSQLLAASIDANQEIRNKAQQEINNLTNNNLEQFLLELSKKQASENEPNEIRQLCATTIKNIIKDSENIWLNLDKDFRNEIKNNILSTLISKDINIKKAAALCIAGICRVELSKGLWLDVFDILINASQNSDIEIKITSLITLQYIYEDVPISYIKKEIIYKLIQNYYSLLSEKNTNDQSYLYLIRTCLQSINKFIPFMETILSDNDSRLIFFNMIKTYMVNNDEQIRIKSMQIFSDLISSFYKFFENYMDTLMNVLLQILEKDTELCKKHAIDILFSIGEIEIFLLNNPYNVAKNFLFLDKYKDKISPFLLQYIKTDNFEKEEFSLSKYCSILINIMCQCCDFSFTEIMLNYYQINIESKDPIINLSALNVFRAILGTREKQKIFHIVKKALPMLSGILVEQQTFLKVRNLLAMIMKSITNNFGFIIVKDHELFSKFMTLFLNLLNDNSIEILLPILNALNQLIKLVETNEYMPSNYLSQFAQNYFQILLNLSQKIELYNNDNNVPMNALFTLGTYGQHVANDVRTISCNVFKSLVEMFTKTLEKNAFNNDQMRLNYQEYICSSLSSFLFNKKCMEKDVKKLFGYVIQSFDDRKEIYDEGISLIGNIAIYLQRGFINEMNTFNKYLLHGLNSTNSLSICKTSLITLSEIITNCENDFNIYVNDYMNLILKILSDNTIVRDLKPRCLQIISDLLVNCRQEVFKYFDDIMTMIGGAIQVCQMDFRAEMDTIDFINYMVELKEAVLETLGCIFNAVIEEGKTNDFIPYAKGVVEFINLILREEGQLNFDIIRNSIGIIADYCRVYGKNIKPILNSGLLKDCIEKFKKSEEYNSNEQMKAFISWAQKCITEVLLSN